MQQTDFGDHGVGGQDAQTQSIVQLLTNKGREVHEHAITLAEENHAPDPRSKLQSALHGVVSLLELHIWAEPGFYNTL